MPSEKPAASRNRGKWYVRNIGRQKQSNVPKGSNSGIKHLAITPRVNDITQERMTSLLCLNHHQVSTEIVVVLSDVAV